MYLYRALQMLDATYDLHMTWADGDAIDTIEFRSYILTSVKRFNVSDISLGERRPPAALSL